MAIQAHIKNWRVKFGDGIVIWQSLVLYGIRSEFFLSGKKERDELAARLSWVCIDSLELFQLILLSPHSFMYSYM